MADDDRAVMERLAVLEAEVKADAEAQRARRQAALDKVRAERAERANQPVERDDIRRRKAEPRDADDLGSAIELAGRAHRVKQELAKKPGKGDKSWIKSAIASTALGPLGWLYAGSLREAVPASAAWLVLVALASKILPIVLMLPVLMVALPLSGLAGVVYALQYNRHGGRQRLFGDTEKKQLDSGR